MREKAADREVVNASPITRADIRGKVVQVLCVSLDGMDGSIPLAQRLEKFADQFLDGRLCDHRWLNLLTTESQKPKEEIRFLCVSVTLWRTSSRFRSRVVLLIHAFQSVERQVCVDLGGRNIRMTQDGLNRTQICAILHHVR